MADSVPQIPGRVVAVAEHREGVVSPVTWELVSCGRQLAQTQGLEFCLLVLEGQNQNLGLEAAQYCGERVIAVKVPGLETFHGEAQRLILGDVLATMGAMAVIGAHTTSGMEWAPGLAVSLSAVFIAGVEACESAEGQVTLVRACHHGKLWEKLRPIAERLVLSVQPGAFEAAVPAKDSTPVLEVIEKEYPTCRTEVEPPFTMVKHDAALGRAQVIVAAGRGVGGPANIALLRELAALFANSALAGSRPVCDYGWLGFQKQVGLTGATVSPRLYIACGISGAPQHIIGMRGADVIVSINSDPEAPIHKISDVAVIEDLTTFIKAFMKLTVE